MNDLMDRPVAERVRTVLARGAAGTVEAGMLRRPLRSARVRDDGVIVLVVDVGGMSREAGDEARMADVGASATVEIVDTVAPTLPRRRGVVRVLDGRRVSGPGVRRRGAVARGVVILRGSSPPPLMPVAAGWSPPTAAGRPGGDLNPWRPSEVAAVGDHLPRRRRRAPGVAPELRVRDRRPGRRGRAGLARRSPDSGFAERLVLAAGREVVRSRVVGVDGRGLDVAVDSVGGFREVLRVPFSQVCRDSEAVRRELETLGS